MLAQLASQQALSEGVLDARGDLSAVKLVAGREDFLPRLEQLLPPGAGVEPAPRAEAKSKATVAGGTRPKVSACLGGPAPGVQPAGGGAARRRAGSVRGAVPGAGGSVGFARRGGAGR